MYWLKGANSVLVRVRLSVCGARCAVAWVKLSLIEDWATIKVLSPWTTTPCVLFLESEPRGAAYLPPD